MLNDFHPDSSLDDVPPEPLNEVEISDLPPAERSHYLLLRLTRWWESLARRQQKRLTRSQRRRAAGRTLTAFGICVMLLVLLFGSAPGLRTRLTTLLQPVPTPTPVTQFVFSNMPVINMRPGDQTPITDPQGSPGALPATCPQISTLQYFMTPLDPPGLGASPIWFSGFNGPSATLHDLLPINAPVVHAPWPAGWYTMLAVFIQKGYTGTITLQGTSQTGNSPVWLSRDSPQILGNSLALNLNDGSHYVANGPWEMTSISVAIPKAGCYTLQVSGASTLWTRYFAAGS